MEERLLPLHATAEGLGTPALACTDALDLRRLQRHGKEHMKGPGIRWCLVLSKHDLIVAVWNVERGTLRIHFDHRTMRIAACCHERALERPERVTRAAHQFSQDLGNTARLARRNRYVVDHCTSPTLQVFYE